MSLNPQYARPRSVDEAVQLLNGLGVGTVVIAGGQEVMPHINVGRLMPSVYVDIGGLAELAGISDADGVVSIGALTVHRTLQRDPVIQRVVPLLADAARAVGGGWQVHNRGTVGGNLVAMHPLYDLAPPLLALQAVVEILTADGRRRMPLATLLTDTRHGLGATSLLTRVLVRAPSPSAGWGYEKLQITAGAYGSANAAAVVSCEGEIPTAGSLVIGAVAERPIDASGVLNSMLGKPFDERVGAQLEAACAQLVTQPLSDQQGDAAWRRAMAGVVARRAVTAALARVLRRR